jgi:hypothetical protein
MRITHSWHILLASALVLGLGSGTCVPTSVLAQQRTHTPARGGGEATRFRLQVSGRPAEGTTFWVAYGPLQNQWGVIRLQARGGGVYSASASLPAGRTTFAYLAAQGSVQTKSGPAPGGVPVTIALLGPTTAFAVAHTTVHWHVPAG